eukprot:CAMPEP_0172471930 /NCGR_PEP_ID=MMETSP1065-20121228/68074_1 /TAXON_ID=265537 /ORGANISM="Amphiprora paludosa, Strain CCMP125" /LENGTH=815 /DNA_ID=CAMNT_0013230045 /DNA_START=70 /DNA_END=2517 /DNA_ORIENTATION=+
MGEPEGGDQTRKRDREESNSANAGTKEEHGEDDATPLQKHAKPSPASNAEGTGTGSSSKSKKNMEVTTTRKSGSNAGGEDQSSSLSDSLEEAQAELSSANEKNAALSAKLEEANAVISQRDKALADAKGELSDTKGDLVGATEELTGVKVALSGTTDELSAANDRLRSADAGWGETKEELTAANERTRSSDLGWNETKEELTGATDRLKSSDKTVGLLSDKLEQSRNELKALKVAAAKAAENSDESALADAKEQIRSSHKTVSLLSDSLEEAQADLAAIKRLQTVKDEARAIKDAEQAIKDQCRAVKDQAQLIKEQDQAIREQAQAAKEQDHKDELALLHAEIASLKAAAQSRSQGAPSLSLAGGGGVSQAQPVLAHPGSAERVVQKDVLSLEVAGRVIGKGGEIIRDLQARSGARMDVDQSAQPGEPRTIIYQGTRGQVDLAIELVRMIASGATEADLPLGEAKREALGIPARIVGKVIGRGGEIVRELQNRSHAKVDFDHDGTRGGSPDETIVFVTGTTESVTKAKEMISFLVANPELDGVDALNMLVDEKLRSRGQWGSGPPYANLPNQGSGIKKEMFEGGRTQVETSQALPPPPLAPPVPQPHTHFYQQGNRSELIYCKKQYVGRIIGSKGATIKDLQQRSGTTIQIMQDVPFGADCEVKITGGDDGVQMAKQMIQQIIGGGADHLFGLGKGGGARSGSVSSSYEQKQNPPSAGHYYGQRQAPVPPPTQIGYQQVQPQARPYVSQHAGSSMPAPQQQQFVHHQMSSSSSVQETERAQFDSGWKTMTQPDGRTYYWNEKTGAVQWEKPPDIP